MCSKFKRQSLRACALIAPATLSGRFKSGSRTSGGLFGFSVPLAAPEAGEASLNLKVVSDVSSDKGDRARLVVSGRPGTAYRMDL